MIERPFWKQRIENAWREAPIVWLCGVRRSGKTTLAESLPKERMLYVNCDLPTVDIAQANHACWVEPGAQDCFQCFLRWNEKGSLPGRNHRQS